MIFYAQKLLIFIQQSHMVTLIDQQSYLHQTRKAVITILNKLKKLTWIIYKDRCRRDKAQRCGTTSSHNQAAILIVVSWNYLILSGLRIQFISCGCQWSSLTLNLPSSNQSCGRVDPWSCCDAIIARNSNSRSFNIKK